MKIQNKSRIVAVFFACLLALPQIVLGLPSVILSNNVDMDFGLIEYSGAGNASVGTDGNVSYSGGFTGAGLGTSGATLVSLTNSTQATIACSATATMTNSTGDTLMVSDIEFVVGSASRTSFGSGTPCQGIGTSSGTFTFSGTVNNRTIYVGGRINAAGPLSGAGNYSSANAGGSSITIVVTAI